MSQKKNFYDQLIKISHPLMEAAAASELVAKMPVRQGASNRQDCSHLEAVARLFCGLAPALELQLKKADDVRYLEYIPKARLVIENITSPKSRDFLNFTKGTQPLVDAAFLAQAFLRAPQALWHGLSSNIQKNVLNCFYSTRQIRSHFNNWLLFPAIIEAFLYSIGEPWDQMRVDYALRQHEQWYAGDGTYKEGWT